MFRLIAQFFAFKVFKFSLKGTFPKEKKYVIAVVPHTSNWDFIIAIGVRTYLKEPIHFVGKKELFTPLTSWFFRGLGGMPLNRKKNEKVVDAIARMYEEEDVFEFGPTGLINDTADFEVGEIPRLKDNIKSDVQTLQNYVNALADTATQSSNSDTLQT